MRRRRQHAARIAKSKRDAAELLANNAATIARSDLTPDERRDGRRLLQQRGSPPRSRSTPLAGSRPCRSPPPRRIGTNGTAADDALLNTSPESPPSGDIGGRLPSGRPAAGAAARRGHRGREAEAHREAEARSSEGRHGRAPGSAQLPDVVKRTGRSAVPHRVGRPARSASGAPTIAWRLLTCTAVAMPPRCWRDLAARIGRDPARHSAGPGRRRRRAAD